MLCSINSYLPYQFIFNTPLNPIFLKIHLSMLFKKNFPSFFFFLISLNRFVFFITPSAKFAQLVIFNNFYYKYKFILISTPSRPIFFSKLSIRLLSLSLGNVLFVFKKHNRPFLSPTSLLFQEKQIGGGQLIGFLY